MMTNEHASTERHEDRGVSILLIAVSMIFILGMAGLGIDLASLYVGRSQAQRAADAAALAAANYLADPLNGCMSGMGGGLPAGCVAVAKQKAEAVGNDNLIAGMSPNLQDSDITFLSTSASDPQVQVIAGISNMPTFFVKIFGINSAKVAAKAVAEAYTPDSSGPGVGARCIKPWLIPNCDPGNIPSDTGLPANPYCTGGVGGFVNAVSGSYASTLARDSWVTASYPTDGSGPKGEPYTLKPGSPGGAAAPGQYYAAYVPTTNTAPSACPSCASSSPGGGGTGSAAVYRENIECCNQNPIVCGPNTITLASTAGNMVGPTQQGVDCLIHQSGSSWPSNCGQDKLTSGNYPSGVSNPCGSTNMPAMIQPLHIMAGPNNVYNTPGSKVPSASSNSVVSLPIWDGAPLQSGQNPNIIVVGFLQLFIQGEGNPQGTVYGTILGVSACGSGGSGTGSTNGTGGPIIAPGGSSVPVRLIHE